MKKIVVDAHWEGLCAILLLGEDNFLKFRTNSIVSEDYSVIVA